MKVREENLPDFLLCAGCFADGTRRSISDVNGDLYIFTARMSEYEFIFMKSDENAKIFIFLLQFVKIYAIIRSTVE